MHPHHSIPYIISRGLTGMGGSIIAVIAPFQEQLEWWVRITGGFLGVAIAGVTLFRLLSHPKIK